MANMKMAVQDLLALDSILLQDIMYHQDMITRFPTLKDRMEPALKERQRLLQLFREVPRNR